MIETIELAVQLIFTAVSAGFSLFRFIRSRNRAWLLMCFAAAVYCMGDVYWQMYLVFYGHTPHYSMIPSLAWYSAYLFLLLLLEEVRGAHEPRRPVRKILFAVPVFTAGMSVYFSLQRELYIEYIDNLLIAAFMTPLLWNTVDCLIDIRRGEAANPACKWLCFLILAVAVSEYAMWTISLQWPGDTLANPYYWFDVLLSLTFLLLIPAVEKAVKH